MYNVNCLQFDEDMTNQINLLAQIQLPDVVAGEETFWELTEANGGQVTRSGFSYVSAPHIPRIGNDLSHGIVGAVQWSSRSPSPWVYDVGTAELLILRRAMYTLFDRVEDLRLKQTHGSPGAAIVTGSPGGCASMTVRS